MQPGVIGRIEVSSRGPHARCQSTTLHLSKSQMEFSAGCWRSRLHSIWSLSRHACNTRRGKMLCPMETLARPSDLACLLASSSTPFSLLDRSPFRRYRCTLVVFDALFVRLTPLFCMEGALGWAVDLQSAEYRTILPRHPAVPASRQLRDATEDSTGRETDYIVQLQYMPRRTPPA